jgi:microcompartment protein CcmL/EutN
MERQALGLIETVGLVAAIEATDAAAKAASVVVVRSEVTEAALVTIHIEGELAAVQAAVEAGVAACKRLGQVHTHTVIPRPDVDLSIVLDKPSQVWRGKTASRPPVRRAKSSTGDPAPSRNAAAAQTRRPPILARGPQDYESMTVSALRRLARRRGDLPISGREIAHADKDTLVRLLREAKG